MTLAPGTDNIHGREAHARHSGRDAARPHAAGSVTPHVSGAGKPEQVPRRVGILLGQAHDVEAGPCCSRRFGWLTLPLSCGELCRTALIRTDLRATRTAGCIHRSGVSDARPETPSSA